MEQSNKEGKLPDWMYSQEAYAPSKDKDAFITKSTKSLLTVFGRIHFTEGKDGRFSASSSLKLILYLDLYNYNSQFPECIVCAYYVCGSDTPAGFFPAASIRQILSGTISAILLSAFILLPSIFMGNPQTLVNITCRVYVSVTLIGILSAGTSWNKLTRSLRNFHVSIFVYFYPGYHLKIYFPPWRSLYRYSDFCQIKVSRKKIHKKQALCLEFLELHFLKSEEMADEMHAACTAEDLREIIQCLQKNRYILRIFFFYIVILLGCIGLFFLSK